MRITGLVLRPLVPSCDRCGSTTPIRQLHDDGIGWICPQCRIYPEAVHG
jgi:hypothetical protein